MKKVLFCSALLALVAGCAENELDSLSTPQKGQGISFEAEAPTTRMQWDETETSYVPFWYAEQDRIGLFAVNVKKGAFGSEAGLGRTTTDNWTGLPDTEASADATYKATQSQRTGAFTAITDGDLLHFANNGDARFLAVYPSTVKAKYDGGKVVLSSLPKLSEQNQATTKGYNEATLMYSMSIAARKNSYDAVGEKVNLQFKRPLSALVFSTENVNDYTTADPVTDESIFGNLMTITVEAKGWTPESGGLGAITPSTLAYDESVATIEVDTINYAATFKAGSGTESNKIELTLGDAASGLAWNDDALAVVAIKDVDRSETFSAEKKETMEVVFSFDKIDLTMTNSTKSNWDGFIEYPTLNINNYPYLVTKGKSSSTRTLIVNNGNFNDIFAKNGKIAWTDTEGAEVELSEIATIISNVKLTDVELGKIKLFTNLKSLTLKENASVPANTFSTAQASAITKLDLPKVTSIDAKFINGAEGGAFAKIATLLMPAYQFENAKVNAAFFNDGEKGELVTLDMSGVNSMLPTFGVARTLSFEGYEKLATVTVKDNLVASPSGFADCVALKTINGKLDITDAPSVFKMTTDENDVLESVELVNRMIPADAFNNCTALETVKYNGSSIAPTAIGSSAFANTTALKYMDLSEVATIGASAFEASGITSTSKNTETLTVGATELPASIFKNCANIEMVKFTNATKITGDEILAGNTKALIQIKFLKVISLADAAAANAYGKIFGETVDKTKTIDFWTNPEQPGVDGLTFTLSYKNGTTTVPQVYTFSSIQKKIAD
jgi:hypothetical protein